MFEVEHVLFSRHFQNFQNIATPRDLKSYKSLQVPDDDYFQFNDYFQAYFHQGLIKNLQPLKITMKSRERR